MRRPALLLALAVSCLLGVAEPALGQRFRECRDRPGTLCGKVVVPLDRSGAIPGRVSLRVERYRPLSGRRRGALFALAGGPGQSATLSFTEDAVPLLAPALRSRELVVFDQRGTGFSGLLRCRRLEKADLLDAGKEAAQCADAIGAKRAAYTTRETVEDIEAVRKAIRVDKISLYGVSYGTKVALAYAQAYPDRVERLVLDSVLEASGPDPLYFDIYRASGRVLRTLCRGRACRGITSDPVRDLRQLIARIAASGPIRGFVVGRDGRRRRRSVGRDQIFQILVAGDFDASLRADLPAAMRSALRGDPAPLMRLAARAAAVEGGEVNPREFSVALYATTVCEEAAFPWARTTPFDQRVPVLRDFLSRVPEDLFAPWDRETAVVSDEVRLCERWPTSPDYPALRGSGFPDVPVLLLNGEDDTRTPLEGARRVARQFKRASLVEVPAVGHSVLGTDPTRCSVRAFRQFWANQRVTTRCGRPNREFPPTKLLPTSLDRVPRPSSVGGKRGRTVSAAALTLLDAESQADTELLIGGLFSEKPLAGGGLRGGRWFVGFSDIALVRYEFIPGVVVSGRGPFTGFGTANLRIRGRAAARGSVAIRSDGRFSGRLDGRPVRGVLPRRPFFESPEAVRAGADEPLCLAPTCFRRAEREQGPLRASPQGR